MFALKNCSITQRLIAQNVIRRHASSVPGLHERVARFDIQNEPILQYLPGSEERIKLEQALARLSSKTTYVPLVIDGKQQSSDLNRKQVAPFDHQKVVAEYSWSTQEQLQKAINSALVAKERWEKVPVSEKIAIFRRAADLVAGKYRHDLNAATMLGQGKTAIQAEIDAACELADFFRFNARFLVDLLEYQPLSPSPNNSRNTFRYRALDGFVASISPFNFTAIGGNLASAPTLMDNTVLWKPSDTSVLSNYIVYTLLLEAGMPSDVIQFVPSQGTVFGDSITAHSQLACINFTGSVATFKHLWKQVALRLDTYGSYPRLIGECGGKNFHFVHSSADLATVAATTVRSAFEYSGQKCSACSRLYVPESVWPKLQPQLVKITSQLKLGSPLEFDTFLSAVITETTFDKVNDYVEYARNSSKHEILVGGKCDKTKGFFIEPTVIRVNEPNDRLLTDELFAPVLAVHVYPDSQTDAMLTQLQKVTQYALTGAIFAQDDAFLAHAVDKLKGAAGNLYLNDKSTGSVVGQQPFGGGRLSGTNDKAGGPHYLLRFASPQNVKETFVPQLDVTYDYMRK